MMTRMMILLAGLAVGLSSCAQNAEPKQEIPAEHVALYKFPVQKSADAWKAQLTKKQYYVLREAGTEIPFTNEYWDNKKQGIYVCAGCENEVFSSASKYKSGTGWPSFWEPIADDAVGTATDNSLFMKRVEVHCADCGGHLGHVFEDGPDPTGLRYCMNSAAMKFVER
ncbi:MAG: peptide-methionine (R)-S-oxide reductase MsrB [Catalinimonas sp.]